MTCRWTIKDTINGLEGMILSTKFIEHDFNGIVNIEACEQAIDLLKAQEPRVMTLEEVKDYDKPVWIDEKGWGNWRLPFYKFDLDIYAIFGHECFLIEDYGREWLPWTSRPTDEQREAAKWDE